MICCCALRPWSRTIVIYQSFWFLDLVVLSCCAGMECRGSLGWLHICEMDMGHTQPKLECGCCEILVFGVSGATQNFYAFSLNRNPDPDDRIYDCLLTAMTPVQAADERASFLFVGDLNGHHQKWLGSLPRTVMVLRPSILPLCQVMINW